jgi:hypothetical protein
MADLSLDGRGRPPPSGGRVRVLSMADKIFSGGAVTLIPNPIKGEGLST